MKKVLLAVPLFLLWLLYVVITINERNRYEAGKAKGMHCHTYRPGYFVEEYEYSVGKKPEREYMRWGEFWKWFGY